MQRRPFPARFPAACLLAAALLVFAAAPPADAVLRPALRTAPAWSKAANFTLLFGRKLLNTDEWEPLEQQLQLGAEFDYLGPSWPIGLSGALLRSSGTEDTPLGEVSASVYELQLGLRKIWYRTSQELLRPYVGAGPTVIYAVVDRDETGLSDSSGGATVGAWLGAGVYAHFGQRWNLGLDLRYSIANANVGGKNLDPGGLHLMATVGYHWNDWQ